MDALTAGWALVISKFSVAIIMVGIYGLMPHEKFTRDWALAAILVSSGALIVILNAGAPRSAIILVGNGIIVLGMIMQWSGIRNFYRKPAGYLGWATGALFLAMYLWLLIAGAPLVDRAVLISATVLVLLILNALEFGAGYRARPSFGSMLAVGSASFLVLCFIANLGASSAQIVNLSHWSSAPLAISLFYLIPVTASVLLTTAMVVMLLERLIAERQHVAAHDELTALLNRQAIVASGERELAIAKRTGEPIAVAYVDIDNFKQINDGMGRKAGDRILAEVAAVISKTCRSTDLIGRYDGDEFCVVLPNAGRADAKAFGERLLETVRRHRFNDGAMTLSVGVAVWDGTHDDSTWDDLISQAGQELYKARCDGGNRFCVSNPESHCATETLSRDDAGNQAAQASPA